MKPKQDRICQIVNSCKRRVGAEALYYAYFKYRDGKFELQRSISQNYSVYRYFGAKGLVVMAKNYYELKIVFKDLYFENVIKKFFGLP
jgi:hypothetical protein